MSEQQPLFQVVTTSLGVKSIRNNVVNEIMHNPVGPWVEANKLYIEQSNLRERLRETSEDPLVIYDVGLGAAANALAVLHCAREGFPRRKIHLVSFEKDLNLLRFALENAHEFDHFQGYEPALDSILSTSQWLETDLQWELRTGEFPDLIAGELTRPHIIFYDPYSPEVNREMWGLDVFKKLHSVCRTPEQGGTILYTYSRATPIRSAMLASDFFVGLGQATGLKEETTQAATDLKLLANPLDRMWLERWKRSHTPYPMDLEESEQASLRNLILGHPQFSL
jgi:queuine tRNA-ribosyltransferase